MTKVFGEIYPADFADGICGVLISENQSQAESYPADCADGDCRV